MKWFYKEAQANLMGSHPKNTIASILTDWQSEYDEVELLGVYPGQFWWCPIVVARVRKNATHHTN